jgi:mRNA-degrading endonuclease RelE of RelBE toxin-antitoxin system
MKKWKIQFTPESARLLSELHPENKRQIKKAIIELRQNPHTGKDLQEELFGFKSLRIRKYRIIYNLEEGQYLLRIYYIGQRRDVYEQFRQLLIDLQKPSTLSSDD